MTVITTNKRAYFDYEILETYEAGLKLLGFETKAVRDGRMNLSGSFVVIRGNEAFLLNASIPPYQPKNTPGDYDPMRTRVLLLHKKEIRTLTGKTAEKGLTLVPLRVYNKGTRLKLEFGVARHKKKHDKRETIKKRETEREIRRDFHV
ncbi:MAG: SsrA-binding protein [Candidatus Sungbacteria bacterium RIFCSPLOWO2_02_FULL_51_17]|uniref:SsrA-binding protein n=1 Tax=Candidatus Sungbacteria bacterium RIFCSPHIGHO2_02_FULL_51_29 TaxID=1802273 RepID=A0A1G2KRF7_9BACT|nr:MAG: SsrA-binding protein [Candidatus Sungbacteria bacterium RIFCSPHIGHO2_01_FULL_51_22]OHA02027.1 MAG: SsrA-binding protein [Candidatus Sungbacteria bacterium RIFCSPHIGHO2_02_FULL_51_29]OHA05181.1 MAG: SsrA-binding protein [Candidatus Sungbacteria bacterium RIFCSPLOWO2_01_FULL_51_34]OHA10821.1 MAG: SsrA-binding protein [Candidatus Sungbacteria bacterium RIFCSPLOWO2_02_FULL_51_17]